MNNHLISSGFFITPSAIPASAVQGEYQPLLVLLSYVIVSVAAYVAISILRKINPADSQSRRWGSIAGAVAMGTGIWSMHFIGMLAFKMDMAHTYDPGLTALSMLIAAGFSWTVFRNITAKELTLRRLFDLQLLTEEVCEMMAFKANEKGVDLLLRYPLDAPRYVIGDPGRVRQILFNLSNNALKFTENGHVLISLQSAAMDDGKLKLHVEVEDTGIGIPADKTELIFNKFSRADQSTARKFGGTGLGLSICKELTHMMGGDIGVRSTYGVGSTFWFDIMLAEEKTGDNAFLSPKQSVLKGLRVLVVDDNEAARVIVREQLLPLGMEVTEAADGKQALEILEKDSRFDIAVLDFMMPQMDGAELAHKIKAHPAAQTIPLLMITSAPNRGDKNRMEVIGFAGYLSKPLASWHMRDAIAVIVEAHKAGRKIPMVTLV